MATAHPFSVVVFENKSGTVSYRVIGNWQGKRTRNNFPDRATADRVCNNKNAEALADIATQPTIRLAQTRLSEAELASAESGVERIAERWPLASVITAGIAALEAKAAAPKGQPVAALLERWLVLIEQEVGERWLKDLRSHGRSFMRANPGLLTTDLSRVTVRRYLDGRDFTAQSKSNARNALHRFGRWLVEAGHMAENPAAGIHIARKTALAEGESPPPLPAVFTARQAEAWLRTFEAAEFRRLKGWAVLCTLCGLRPENEAQRLLWSEIDLPAATLRVLGTKRGQKPRVIKLQPSAVAWLHAVKADGEPTPGHFTRSVRRRAVARANDWLAKHHPAEKPIAWEEDIQRHSFASYRLGQGSDVQAVAEEMGNSARVIYGYYRNPRGPEEVAAFWRIMPTSETVRLAARPHP